MRIDPFFYAYIAAWAAACAAAAALVLRSPERYAITHRRYWRFLLQPWKIVTFLIAAAGITVIAPYTGDPTWDYADAIFMSVLTFASAPWSVGVLYRAGRRMAGAAQAYVALCAMLFSASWSYDLYLLFRDGDYPATWWSNMAASSILYLLAGMLWNLESREGRGVIFGFFESDWPNPEGGGGFSRLVWFALPIMALVAALILPFLWGGWG